MSEFESSVVVWIGQATAIMAVGLGASILLRRRPALAHATLVLAVLVVAALPLASWAARSAGVGLLPAAPVASDAREHDVAGADSRDVPREAEFDAPRATHAKKSDANAAPAIAAPSSADPLPAARAGWQLALPSLGTALGCAWLAISSVLLLRLVVGIVRGAALRRDSEPIDRPAIRAALHAALHAAARDLGVHDVPELRASDAITAPLISCWRKPCIIVPRSSASEKVDWRAVMAHELAHLVRRDHLTALLGELLACALPWHPFAWAIRARISATAEESCDEWALGSASSDVSYAESLVAFVPQRGLSRLAPAIVARGGVVARVTRILSGTRRGNARVGRLAALGVSLTALGGLAAIALARPRSAAPLVEPPAAASDDERESAVATGDLDAQLAALVTAVQHGNRGPIWDLARDIAKCNDPRMIPTMIGVIDADESYDTVYGVGYFGLASITGVDYSPYHDGVWWRRWWETNKSRYPTDVQAIAIPDLPQSDEAKSHTPYPENLDTLDGKIAWMLQEFRGARTGGLRLSDIAGEIAKHEDPSAIPAMIGVIDADNSYDTIYGVGYFGLGKLTGVNYSPYHDGAWWRRWWDANKSRYPAKVQAIAIPKLPQTEAAKKHTPFPESLDTVDGKIAWMLEAFRAGRTNNLDLSAIAREIAEEKDPRAIPVMIGIIDADNSYDTIYGVGYFGLGRLAGVEYSPYHDGPWWRRWWDENKSRYPADVQALAIPELPKSARGAAYEPMPQSFDTFEGKLAWLRAALENGHDLEFDDFARALVADKDPRAIPVLIGLIDAEGTNDTIYGVGYHALGRMLDVRYDESHDGAWWRRWWDDNKARFPREAQDTAIPDYRELVAGWRRGAAAREAARLDAEFAGIPCEDLAVGGDARKRYFLMGPPDAQAMPADGWKLLLILPGGGGGPDFQPFCRAIDRDALPAGFIAAELVAPVWSDNPNRTVWPTSKLNRENAAFTTEEFIRAVVDDVAARLTIDRDRVYALGWSSSGPALYCDSLQADSPIKGWFVAMSVFRPQWMPELSLAKGRRYYILHSPDDTLIPIDAHATVAEKNLREAGADVKLVRYGGGHGWTEDPMRHIRDGVEWLDRPRE